MSSTYKNAIRKRTYRERAQPASRERLGLLEKHKDYVLRARDYHRKQTTLKNLKEKARFKNDDEFYFGMIKAQVKNGVHIKQRRTEQYDGDELKLLKSQDRAYIKTQRSINQAKIQRLKASLAFIQDGSHVDETEYEDDDKSMDEIASSVPEKPKHIVFVDETEELETFDPVEFFDTEPAFLDRSFNRPKRGQIQQLADMSEYLLDEKTQKESEQHRLRLYKELAARLDREEKLKQVEKEMEMQHLLTYSKGSKKQIGVDEKGNPKYKWRYERAK